MTRAVLFAGVIKLLIAAPTQLLLRALILSAADARLLRTGSIADIQSLVCLRPKEVCSSERRAGI